jgi:hypothetical protein
LNRWACSCAAHWDSALFAAHRDSAGQARAGGETSGDCRHCSCMHGSSCACEGLSNAQALAAAMRVRAMRASPREAVCAAPAHTHSAHVAQRTCGGDGGGSGLSLKVPWHSAYWLGSGQLRSAALVSRKKPAWGHGGALCVWGTCMRGVLRRGWPHTPYTLASRCGTRAPLGVCCATVALEPGGKARCIPQGLSVALQADGLERAAVIHAKRLAGLHSGRWGMGRVWRCVRMACIVRSSVWWGGCAATRRRVRAPRLVLARGLPHYPLQLPPCLPRAGAASLLCAAQLPAGVDESLLAHRACWSGE